MATTSQPPAPTDDDDAADSGSSTPGPMHAALDHASDTVAGAAQVARDGASVIGETLSGCIDEACHITRECADEARARVRAQPLVAVVAVFALGLLIGRLSR